MINSIIVYIKVYLTVGAVEVTRVPLTKHDRYVSELCKKISSRYDSLSTNVKIRNSKRSIAEIDVLARKGKRYHTYEVKCSHRITKAKKQLKRIRRIIGFDNTHAYFYCGSSKSLMLVF